MWLIDKTGYYTMLSTYRVKQQYGSFLHSDGSHKTTVYYCHCKDIRICCFIYKVTYLKAY